MLNNTFDIHNAKCGPCFLFLKTIPRSDLLASSVLKETRGKTWGTATTEVNNFWFICSHNHFPSTCINDHFFSSSHFNQALTCTKAIHTNTHLQVNIVNTHA